MKGFSRLIFGVFIGLNLSSCSSINSKTFWGNAMGNAADTELRYTTLECKTLQQRCVQGDYQEWETSDKQMGCSCKKL